MANGSAMVEEGDEIELSLGLSIGGSYRKSEKSKQIDQKSTCFPEKIDSKPTSFDTDVRENYQSFSRSSASSPVQALMDPQAKRVIHALRRQEVRKKREEKQMKKGVTCKERNGGYMNGGFENKLCLEAQQFQTRVRDREIKENEAANIEERTRKSNKNGCVVNGELKNVNLSLNHNPTLSLPASPPIPVVPMQYAYPHLQYVPLTNGFAFPYVMPCWAPSAATVYGTEKNFFHPVACRSFRPYQVLQSSNCNSGENSSKDGGNRKTASNGSPVCSSSAVSDYRTTSWEGDSSSYTGSRSSNSQPQPPQRNASPTSDTRGQSEYSASSQQIESTQGIDKATNYTEKVVSLNIAQSSPLKPKEEPISETRLGPVNKPISTAENPNPGPLKEAKGDMNKPPRPQTQGHDTPPLSQMPCVSTTGNGPNGKTITGFLYRYTKTEVSIVCVCHGSSFSPAEFVEHAGGTDVSHPLRHITVVPSAFG